MNYPTINNVSSSRGAPMGRESWKNAPEGPVKLFRLPLDSGGYDPQGAYWGQPDDLWCATDGSNFRAFVRAESFQEAADAVHVIAQTWGLLVFLEPDPLLDVVSGYIRCLFFCNESDGDYNTEWEGKGADDLSPEAQAVIERDCADFLKRAWLADILRDGVDYEQVGIDLFYTANRHGVGFWDRPEVYGEPFTQPLTDLAHEYGETNECVGDDGKVYL